MNNNLSKENIFDNLKVLIFQHNERSDENLESLFTIAMSLNDNETIKRLATEYNLIDAIRYLEKMDDKRNNSDLIELIVRNAGYSAIKNAIDQDAYINKKDSAGDTALIIASLLNEVDIVKLLLKHDADVHIRLQNGTKLVKIVFMHGYQEILELLIDHGADDILDEFAQRFFYSVDKKISSQYIAQQFVYEELDAARQGNADAKHFVVKSGVKEEFYIGAMSRSIPEVDGADSPQQILVFHSLMPIMNENNKDLIAKIRILTVEKIMNKYRIGKYEKKITKLTLDNQSVVYMHHDHAVIDDEKFEFISEYRYYHPARQIYLELLNNAVAFFKPTYGDKDEEKEYFGVTLQEDILKYDVKHDPKRLVEILNYFTKDNPIKYTAHSFDWNKYGSYENFISEVKKTFETIDDDLKFLSPNLYEKISKFLFSNQLNESNTWGMSRIGLGWSSPELQQWAHLEDSKPDGKKAIYFPLPAKYVKQVNSKTISNFDDVCDVFKNEIEIRDDDKLISVFEELEENILGFDDGFEVEYINLEGVTFYTDVENFRNGLEIIFEQFKESNRKQHKQIIVETISHKNLNYLDLKITQVGSFISKNSDEMQKEIKDGSFEDIKNYFTSLCDWRIETKNKEENFGIKYLSIESEEIEIYTMSTEPKGFSHVLRFYK